MGALTLIRIMPLLSSLIQTITPILLPLIQTIMLALSFGAVAFAAFHARKAIQVLLPSGNAKCLFAWAVIKFDKGGSLVSGELLEGEHALSEGDANRAAEEAFQRQVERFRETITS